MATATAQAFAARPRVNGSGSNIPPPPSLLRACHTLAAPSTVAVRFTSNVLKPSRLPIRSVVPARAFNVSLLFPAFKHHWPQCLLQHTLYCSGGVTFSWNCICTSYSLPLNLHIITLILACVLEPLVLVRRPVPPSHRPCPCYCYPLFCILLWFQSFP